MGARLYTFSLYRRLHNSQTLTEVLCIVFCSPQVISSCIGTLNQILRNSLVFLLFLMDYKTCFHVEEGCDVQERLYTAATLC